VYVYVQYAMHAHFDNTWAITEVHVQSVLYILFIDISISLIASYCIEV
jgi:hypothetical protein